MKANVLRQLAPDREHWMERRQRVLEHHPDLAAGDGAPASSVQPQQILASERRAPLDDGTRREQAEQREHGHRLAATALARDPEHLRRLDLVVDAVHDRREPGGRRQPHAKALDLEQRAHRVWSPPQAVCGSNRSRRLSPRKLKASTAVKMASPGNVPIHHHWKYCAPSATIEPHSACGG